MASAQPSLNADDSGDTAIIVFNNGSATLSFDEGDLGGRGYNVSAGSVAGTYFATATAALGRGNYGYA